MNNHEKRGCDMIRKTRVFIVLLLTFVLMLPAGINAEGEEKLDQQGQTDQAEDFKVLKILSEGQEVVDLQMRLRDLGYFNYKVTGYFGAATQSAVRNFQERNGLYPDGTVGPQTAEVLYSDKAVRQEIASGKNDGLLPVSRGGRTSMGQMYNWFTTVQYIYTRNTKAKVTDLYTGISFYMIRTGGTLHADVEPATSADSKKIKQIWGGWSWNRRPVIVDVGGERIAASMHGMPHAYDFISGNGMDGHVCIHFYKSRTHIRNAEDYDHQAAVRRAAGK